MTEDTSEPRFPEESLRRIIRDAVALQEQRSDTYSEHQIRSMLTELGISESVIEQALRNARQPAGKRNAHPSMVPVLDSGILGVATGLATATALPFIPGSIVLVPAMWGAGLMFSGILASRNAHVSAVRYHGANLALWTGMAGAYLVTTGVAKPLLAGSAVTVAPWAFAALWAFSSVAGTVLTRYDGSARGPGRFGKVVAAVTGVRSRVVKHIKAWADSLTSRSVVRGTGEACQGNG